MGKIQGWIKIEIGNQAMGDVRLNKKFVNMIGPLNVEPLKSFPCANDTWSETLRV